MGLKLHSCARDLNNGPTIGINHTLDLFIATY
jgi:hypothetical protein